MDEFDDPPLSRAERVLVWIFYHNRGAFGRMGPGANMPTMGAYYDRCLTPDEMRRIYDSTKH